MSQEPALDNEVVVAGAGTGKTHTLVNAYLFTLLGLDASREAKSPHRVLAITFTDKAAAEMRRRVALRLGALARNPNEDLAVVERARSLELPLPPPSLAAELESRLPSAPISTFHALCGNLLRDLALHANIDPGFAILDGNDEREILEESAEAVVLDALAEGNPEVASLIARFQLRRVGFGQGVVDGLVAVHQLLAERGLSPRDIRALVTPEGAQAQLRSRRMALRDAMGALRDESRGRSAYVTGQVRWVIEAYRNLAAALDDDSPSREFALAQRYHEVREPLARSFGDQAVRILRQSALRQLDEVGAALCDRATAPEAVAVQHLLERLQARVEREKNARGVLGFGDLLLRTRDLLRDLPAVRARVKARFDRILVDEYQDTSPVQEDLVALLAEEPARGDRPTKQVALMGQLVLGRGRLFVVGDPKQSIYGFRGADSRIFAHTLRVVTEGTSETPRSGTRRALNRSFRSRPALLHLVNLVADATLGEGAGGVEMAAEDHLLPHRRGGALAGALLMPDLEAAPPMPRSAQVRTFLDEAEAIVVARKARTLLDDALAVGDDDRPLRARDIAVLVRRMRAAEPIARALAHEGIPSQITGGEGFFARPEVRDVIAALRLVTEPQDELAALTVLRSPLACVPDETWVTLLDGLPRWRKGLNWNQVCEALAARVLPAADQERLERLQALIERLRARLHHSSVARMVDAFIDEGGYDLAIGISKDASERMANLVKLRALAEAMSGDAVSRIGRLWDFLDDPPQEGLASVADPDADAVRIMTIHQSKGLEFPVVFVADGGSALPSMPCVLDFDATLGLAVSTGSRGIASCAHERSAALPEHRPALERVRRLKKEREMSELSRLLYVALTRARDFVYFVGEERRPGAPSLRRFLERGRARHGDAFERVFPTERMPPVAGPRRPLPTTHLPDVTPVLELPPRGPLRLVPSALRPASDRDAAPVDETPVRRASEPGPGARERGRLAHRLFAAVGEEATPEDLDDPLRVRTLLRAALRAEGEGRPEEHERLLRDVEVTLCGPLRALVREGYVLNFEEPLRLHPSPGAVLYGSADLVARAPDALLVIDLKSSAAAARSSATRLQLVAYASALSRDTNLPLRYGAWVFGDAHPPAPWTLSSADENLLLHALEAPLGAYGSMS